MFRACFTDVLWGVCREERKEKQWDDGSVLAFWGLMMGGKRPGEEMSKVSGEPGMKENLL